MGKIKISPKRKTYTKSEKLTQVKELPALTNFDGLIEDKPREFILNRHNIGNAIMECLIENDPEGVVEIIGIYLKALNKEKFRQKASIGKSTYYYLMKSKNPTIKTLAKIVHSMAH